jgi:DNA helicase-2/ATP-dependent DNA helicase PcrA
MPGKGRARRHRRNISGSVFLLPWREPAFRPEAIPFELVKEINLKREYSFTSDITLYETCAEQYRFFKELKFAPVRVGAMMFGTLVHQTIEDIHKAVLRGEAYKVTPGQIDTWFPSPPCCRRGAGLSCLRRRGCASNPRYVERERAATGAMRG